MGLCQARIAPIDSLQNVPLCDEFEHVMLEYIEFIDTHKHIKYITLDMYSSHCMYVARLNGILTALQLYAYSVPDMKITYDLCVRRKEAAVDRFESKLDTASARGLLKQTRSFRD